MEERRTRMGNKNSKIITIDYITGGRYDKHHSLLDMPAEVRLTSARTTGFCSPAGARWNLG